MFFLLLGGGGGAETDIQSMYIVLLPYRHNVIRIDCEVHNDRILLLEGVDEVSGEGEAWLCRWNLRCQASITRQILSSNSTLAVLNYFRKHQIKPYPTSAVVKWSSKWLQPASLYNCRLWYNICSIFLLEINNENSCRLCLNSLKGFSWYFLSYNYVIGLKELLQINLI